MNSKKEILVTGGAGFIGSHTVVSLYNSGYFPIIVDDFRNSKSWIIDRLEKILNFRPLHYQVDCNDEAEMRTVFEKHPKIEGVIHFAADKAVGESVKHPLKYYRNNLNSLIVLLELMEEFNVESIVFSSSCTVYGEPEVIPVDEEAPIQKGTSPYADTKIICERIITNHQKALPSLKGVLLRYFNPIGAHPSGLIGELPQGIPNNLVPYITQTAKGIRESLTVFGDDYDTPDGTNIRDYIHVMDLANAHVKALNYTNEKKVGFVEAFNIGTGQGSSVLEIIHNFEEVSGKSLNYTIGKRREGDVVAIYAKPDKANSTLHWKANYSVKEALAHAWNWEQNGIQ